ncbi:hypothetical protein BSK51_06750 [Paenibacillus odorifer]|uniref:Uncharacterized protein n=1 Tax=Paenibacillus odorifer TaxID=189426 RepID=A0ABX3HUF6_9BACL|nr:hypothetical protein BSK51_06750 [Paenibacillus odorifer]
MLDAGTTTYGLETHTYGAVKAALTSARKRNRQIAQKLSAKTHKIDDIEKQKSCIIIVFR